ncbi:MAG: RNA-binding domain-containing protein, partial [Nanoarchaeota archaeon]
MDSEELKILLKEKENLTLEYKEAYSSKIDEDIVAFANTKGGILILGVSDKGQIKGYELTNDLKAKINTLARNCKPSISVIIKHIENVITIEVPEGDEKPYSCSTGYFRRLDGNSQKMSQDEIRILFQENDKLSFEAKINKNCTINDISPDKVKKYLAESKVTLVSQDLREILQSANVLEKDKIKNAGVLLFAKDVSKFLPQRQTINSFTYNSQDFSVLV